MSYDVIVVGGGPAGLVCGRRCAEFGLKTLIIDRKQELGTPVRCGEGLHKDWMDISGVLEDKSWCCQKIDGAVVYSPSGKKHIINTGTYGYVIERKIFEKRLAENAISKGCRIMLKTNVTDVLKEGKKVSGVKIENQNGISELKSKVVVAADGVDSRVARFAGLSTFSPLSEVDSGYEYEMANLKFENTDKIHLYFGNEIAKRGYVWLFPKSDTVANVGIGVKGDSDKTAKYCLDEFIKAHPEIFENASITEIKGGCIPVGAPLKKPYAEGLVVIGDAAKMVNPIHGGGIGTGMESGLIAAEHIKTAIESNNYSFEGFAKEWYAKRGNEHLRVLKVRKFFEQLSDEDIENISKVIDSETLLALSEGKKFGVLVKLLSKYPKLALLAAKVLVS